VARCLGHRLVETWRIPAHLDEAIQAWCAAELARHELSPERLTDRFQAASASTLGQVPETLCDATIDQQIPGGPDELSRRPDAGVAALTEIEALVGHPKSARTATLETVLNEAAGALQAELNDRLADMALSALSAPQFRLTGAVEAVRNRLLGTLAEAARSQKALTEQLVKQAADLHRQVVALQAKLAQSSRWWGSRARTAADLLDAIRRYARAGCQVLTAQRLGELYEVLVCDLPKYLREVKCCQPRIAEFLQHFGDPAAGHQPPVDLGLGQYLLPGGCRTLDEAAAHLLAVLGREELLDLDLKVEALVVQRLRKQVHLCTAPATFFQELEEEVYNQVAAFAEAQLTKAHAAEVYLEQHSDDKAMRSDLIGAFDEAAPPLARSGLSSSQEQCILAVPPGPEGKYFRAMAARALPERKLVPAVSTNDIVFYREQFHVNAAALPLLGPTGQEAYQHLLAGDPFTPHSRTDLVDWLPATGVRSNGSASR
jgi:hypothetical protein